MNMHIPSFFTRTGLVLLAATVFMTAEAQVLTTGGGSSSISNTNMNSAGLERQPLSGDLASRPGFIALTARGGLKLPPLEDITGSPFMHSDYIEAYVRTRSGYTAQVPVKFNVFGNEIIFVQNGNELAMDSVSFVSYTVNNASTGPEHIVLKTGYPDAGGNNRNTIYQVLDSGAQAQLLKFRTQKIEEVRSMGVPNSREFVNSYEYYAFAGGEMKKIKADKKSIQDAFPSLSAQVEKIVDEKKLKLKKESDLVLLFTELNRLKAF